MIDITELVEPYVKDYLIDWNYVNENLAMLLTSSSNTIRKLAEVCYRNEGAPHKCNYEFNDVLEGLGGIDAIAASYVKTGLTAELHKNIIGFNSSDITIYLIKSIANRYLNDCVLKGIASKHHGLVVVKDENSYYKVEVRVIFSPWSEFAFQVFIH